METLPCVKRTFRRSSKCAVNILTGMIISACDNIDLVAIKSIVGSGEIKPNDVARLGGRRKSSES